MPPTDTASLLDAEAIRRDFPILQRTLPSGKPLVYLDNAATTQRPDEVIRSLVDVYEQQYANVHRGIHWLSDQSTDLYEAARSKVAQFIGAESSEQVVFTRGTTESINLVARSWGDANLAAGDEIVLTEMEHHSNIVPWQQLAERTGAVVRFAPITDDGRLQFDALEQLIGARTRIVACCAVSNVLGTINPIEEIVRAAHDAQAVVVVDAAQAVPHGPIDLAGWDADFVAFSGHKMLAPSGIGVLYGKRDLLEACPPFMGGGSMIRRVTTEGFEPADLPAKFEAGTPPIVAAVGFGAAIDYLNRIGTSAIAQHERLLTRHAHQVLADIEGIDILGPGPEQTAGIVSFVIKKLHAHDAAQLLDRAGIAVRAGHHCAMPLHKRLGYTATTRASFYFYNTLEEIDLLATAIRDAQQFFRRK